MIRSASPYLNFPGQTEEAFEHYRTIFGGDFAAVIRFRDLEERPMALPEEELDMIAHVALPLDDGTMLMGTDVIGAWQQDFVKGTHSYIHLEVGSGDEADRLFRALSEGGAVQMPLSPTPWAEKYGSCQDRYGVQWMVSYTGSVSMP